MCLDEKKKCSFWTWLNLGLSLAVQASAWARLGQLGHMLNYSPRPRDLCILPSPSRLWSAHIQQQLNRDLQDSFWTPLDAPGLYFTSND